MKEALSVVQSSPCLSGGSVTVRSNFFPVDAGLATLSRSLASLSNHVNAERPVGEREEEIVLR